MKNITFFIAFVLFQYSECTIDNDPSLIPSTKTYTENVSQKIVMSSFTNKDGVKIRTYAAEVSNPKANIILLHALRSHFRADFCVYNTWWYIEYYSDCLTPISEEVHNIERAHVYGPSEVELRRSSCCASQCSRKLANTGELYGSDTQELNPDLLNGRDVLEISPRYFYSGSFIEYLNNMGYSVYGLDLQSHGLSGGVNKFRAYAKSYQDYLYDVLQFVSIVKTGKFHDHNQAYDESLLYADNRKDGLKLFMAGVAMGATLALRALQVFNKNAKPGTDLIDALVSLSTMLNLDNYDKTPKFRSRCIRKFLSYFQCKSLSQTKYDEFLYISINSSFHNSDVLYYSGMLTYATILQLHDMIDDVFNEISYTPKDLPILLLHFDNDPEVKIDVSFNATELIIYLVKGNEGYLSLGVPQRISLTSLYEVPSNRDQYMAIDPASYFLGYEEIC